jgi:hypothetical protein
MAFEPAAGGPAELGDRCEKTEGRSLFRTGATKKVALSADAAWVICAEARMPHSYRARH